jgi:hypothetical protein
MAWEACELGVFPNCVLVVLVHIGVLLRVFLLLRHVLQTAVGCCYTLVDIGVVLRAGISVWAAPACAPLFMVIIAAVVDVVASCSGRDVKMERVLINY